MYSVLPDSRQILHKNETINIILKDAFICTYFNSLAILLLYV
jgi:hypothetical protein